MSAGGSQAGSGARPWTSPDPAASASARASTGAEASGAAQGSGDADASIGARLPRMVAPSDVPLVPSGGFHEGLIAWLGDVRVDGRVAGDLRGSGRVVVGPEGQVDGDIACDEVSAEGVVRGRIVARERVRLGRGARLEGDVEAPLVEVEDGARWDGRVRMERPIRDPGSAPAVWSPGAARCGGMPG